MLFRSLGPNSIELNDAQQSSVILDSNAPVSPQCDRMRTRRELVMIGMSANSDDDTRQCALNAGMNYFIAKPFTIADLLPLLNHAGLVN